MTRTGWRLADQVSQFLDPGEREAVRGDLAECGASGWHTFRQVLGLIARRQAGLWADWRPWLAVIAIVLPIGLMLSHATRWWADGNAVYHSVPVTEETRQTFVEPWRTMSLDDLSQVASCLVLRRR